MQDAQRRLRDYVGRPYKTILMPDVRSDGTPCFVARHPELPGCMSDGDTPAEAVANLRDARELYIQSLIEDGLEVPLPQTVVVLPATTTSTGWTAVGGLRLWEVQGFDVGPKHTVPVDAERLEEVQGVGLELSEAETETRLVPAC